MKWMQILSLIHKDRNSTLKLQAACTHSHMCCETNKFSEKHKKLIGSIKTIFDMEMNTS